MKQNKYDDAEFFAQYNQLSRSQHGLDKMSEWPAFRSILPDLTNLRVLDLGCGFGWHCRFVRENGAKHVVGVDISSTMLAQAHVKTNDPAIEYQQTPIEDIDFPPDSFDLVISSLALHYVADFARVCQQVQRCLVAGGRFVFSVEHPIFTANNSRDWCLNANNERVHWPIDHYFDAGIRHTNWLAPDVVKYHRPMGLFLNDLINNGFQLTHVLEPQVPAELLREHPDFYDDTRRPLFLIIAAERKM